MQLRTAETLRTASLYLDTSLAEIPLRWEEQGLQHSLESRKYQFSQNPQIKNSLLLSFPLKTLISHQAYKLLIGRLAGQAGCLLIQQTGKKIIFFWNGTVLLRAVGDTPPSWSAPNAALAEWKRELDWIPYWREGLVLPVTVTSFLLLRQNRPHL